MFGLDDASQAHQDVYGQDGPQPDNQGSLSHEVLAGAAGFEAMRKYQQHVEANGILLRFTSGFRLTYPALSSTATPMHNTANIFFPTTGTPENHTMAKDIVAGFAAAEADKLVETKGEDFYDREKMRRDARENASNYYDQQYQGGGGQGGDSGYGGNQGGDSGY